MTFRLRIRMIIDFFNTIPPIGFLFRCAYRWQLRAILAALRGCPGLEAVVLRRGLVLQHIFPGESDFDVTCAVKPGRDLETYVPAIGGRLRTLRRIFPSLGEPHVIPSDLFPVILKYGGVIYDPPPCGAVVSATPGWWKPGAIESDPLYALRRAAEDILTEGFNRVFKGQSPSARKLSSRLFTKQAVKTDRYLSIYRTGHPHSLDYRNTLATRTPTMLPREALFDLVESTPAPPRNPLRDVDALENIKVTLTGVAPYEKMKCAAAVQAILSPLIDRHRKWINKAWLTDFRPGLDMRALLLETNAGWFRDSSFASDLITAGRKLSEAGTPVMSGRPIPLTPAQWEFVMAVDPIFNGISRASHRDMLTGIDQRGPVGFGMNRRFLEIEISQTILMLFTVARGDESFYLLDLLFGQLIPYEELLATGTLPIAFENIPAERMAALKLNFDQAAIVKRYANGDIAGINGIDTRKLWKLFADVIVGETYRAAKLIEKSPATQ